MASLKAALCLTLLLLIAQEGSTSVFIGRKEGTQAFEDGDIKFNVSSTQLLQVPEQSYPDSSMHCNASWSSDDWLYCDDGQCNPCSIPDAMIRCMSAFPGNLSVLTSFCATFDETKGHSEAGNCVFNGGNIHRHRGFNTVEGSWYLTIPESVSELNAFMCGELFNRTGSLCGKCKDGHYPLAYSYDMNCVECPDGEFNWWKFVLAAFLPLTVFYFIVLLCKVNVTSSQLHGFVWYSQMLYTPGMARILNLVTAKRRIFNKAARYMGVFYGIWNLAFFRSLDLGICLKVSTLHVLALDLAVGVYPLLLLVLSYLLIQMYSKNYWPMVILWKPFKKLFSLFLTNNWDTRTSLIDAFSTFFFLSNVQFLNTTFDLLMGVTVYTFNSTKCYGHEVRLYYDATIPYFGERHLPYAILAIAVFLIFAVLPALLFLLYPFHWFQKCLNHFPLRWYILHTFMDTYQGCYKDGTQQGTSDCRWFSSMFLLVRLAIFMLAFCTKSSMFYIFASIVLILFSVAIISIKPFKTSVEHYTGINATFVLLLALFNVSLIGFTNADTKTKSMVLPFLDIAFAAAVFPPLYISVIALQWMYRHRKFGLKLINRLCASKHGYQILE